MAKPTVRQTGMSREVNFEVSIGRDANKVALGTYKAKITFANIDEAVDAGARSVVIRMQSNVRKAHDEGKPMPYPTDKMFSVDHMGTYKAPLEEVARQAIAAMTPEMRAAFAKAWQEASEAPNAPSAPSAPSAPYNEDELNKLPRARLTELATKEGFEGLEDMSSGEIIDELIALNN